MNEQTQASYERPIIERIGTLAELTQVASRQQKYFNSSPDFTYPAGKPGFNFSPS